MSELYCSIVIITLNRYEHFKRCVESLEECTDADKTEIYISVDYPKKKEHWEGYLKIVEYLRGKAFTKFKEAHIYYQDTNLGAVNNTNFIRKKLSEDTWRIFIEDDNVFAPGFLQFINNAIQTHKDDPMFFGACGFSRLTGYEDQSWYKGTGYTYGSASSEALRKQAREDIYRIYSKRFTVKQLIKVHRKGKYKVEEYANFLIYNPSVYYDDNNRIRTIDYTVEMWLALTDHYVVMPTISYVRNCGNDGSGVNCGNDENELNFEKNKTLWNGTFFDCSDKNEVSVKSVNKQYKKQYRKKIRTSSLKGWGKIALIKIFGLKRVRRWFWDKNGLQEEK